MCIVSTTHCYVKYVCLTHTPELTLTLTYCVVLQEADTPNCSCFMHEIVGVCAMASVIDTQK